jgi:hypothetical protein
MSNISQTSKDLKKKLSFNDYSTPASQQNSEPSEQRAGAIPAEQHVGIEIPAGSHDSSPVHHEAGAGSAASQRTDMTAPRRSVGKTVQQQAGSKIKATFYLSDEDHQALTSVFIKRLQERKKTDRSALIAEAINMLYKREMR